MKQGTGKKTTAPKEASKVFKPSLGAIARMGATENNFKKPSAETKKIGTSAPRSTVTKHHTGSQGKHK